jgi:hypothetical protein
MTETITKTEAIGKIVALAKEVEIKDTIDWTRLNITEDELYELMADKVIDQLYNCPEEHREAISMSTLTKLLVENFILKVKIEEEKSKNATSTDRS